MKGIEGTFEGGSSKKDERIPAELKKELGAVLVRVAQRLDEGDLGQSFMLDGGALEVQVFTDASLSEDDFEKNSEEADDFEDSESEAPLESDTVRTPEEVALFTIYRRIAGKKTEAIETVIYSGYRIEQFRRILEDTSAQDNLYDAVMPSDVAAKAVSSEWVGNNAARDEMRRSGNNKPTVADLNYAIGILQRIADGEGGEAL